MRCSVVTPAGQYSCVTGAHVWTHCPRSALFTACVWWHLWVSLDRLSFTDQVNPQRGGKRSFLQRDGKPENNLLISGQSLARVWKLLGCLRVEKNIKNKKTTATSCCTHRYEVQFSEEQGLKVDTETHIVLLSRSANRGTHDELLKEEGHGIRL